MKINSKIIDEQNLFFLTIKEWNFLLKKKELGEIQINNKFSELIASDLELMRSNQDLQLAIGRIRNDIWLPYMLLNVNSIWQRISIEIRECNNCEWVGFVGLPDVIDIYLGIPIEIDKIQMIKNRKELQQVGCPNCNEKFKDYVIWVDKKGSLC